MTLRRWRGLLGIAGGAGAGLAAMAWATDGFRALTLDAARGAAVASTPRPVPPVVLVDEATDAPVRFGDGAVTIVDFVSTSCEAICVAQGARFGTLQAALQGRAAAAGAAPIRLLTISFDPDDDARRLDAWRAVRGADPAWWRVVRVAPADRRALLDTFQVTVVRDPIAGWRHNAAFHLVDPAGRLARIIPADEPERALRTADSLAGWRR